jgi:hypothetical protein
MSLMHNVLYSLQLQQPVLTRAPLVGKLEKLLNFPSARPPRKIFALGKF